MTKEDAGKILAHQLEGIMFHADASRADILEKWMDWEDESKSLYLKLMDAYPKCKLWHKLYRDTVNEMVKINYMI